jgi:hypothetical protein
MGYHGLMRKSRHSLGPSRRDWLIAGAGALGSVARLYGKEFWETKDPGEWNPDEVHRLLTRSPWAKEIAGERVKQKQSSSLPRTSGIGGIPRTRIPNSGPADRIPNQAVITSYKGTAVWESAKPVRLSQRQALPPEFDGMYVLGVSGIPLAPTRQQEDGSTPRASRSAMDRLRQATTLRVKGNDPLEAAVARQILDGGNVFYFGFSRQGLEIRVEEKEVEFSTLANKVPLMAKFHPREMAYRGELSL